MKSLRSSASQATLLSFIEDGEELDDDDISDDQGDETLSKVRMYGSTNKKMEQFKQFTHTQLQKSKSLRIRLNAER